jgi:hypothetical protein
MRKVAIGCLAVAGFFVLGCAALVLVSLRELPKLDAEISAPAVATLDQPITLVVTAANNTGKDVTLDSIDIDNAFLAGFQVMEVAPEAEDSSDIPLLDQRTWQFNRRLGPGEQLDVTFNLRPVLLGRFTGDVDVCNPNQDFSTVFVDVVVREK